MCHVKRQHLKYPKLCKAILEKTNHLRRKNNNKKKKTSSLVANYRSPETYVNQNMCLNKTINAKERVL